MARVVGIFTQWSSTSRPAEIVDHVWTCQRETIAMTASSPPGPASSPVSIEIGTSNYPRLVRWGHAYQRETGVSLWHSYVLTTADGPILIDPLMPDGQTLGQLEAIVEQMGGVPAATILTNDMHERGAYVARSQWGIPIWAPSAGAGEYEATPDRLFGASDRLPGGLIAIPVHAAFIGDTLLKWTAPDGRGVLFSGDVFMERGDHLIIHAPGANPRAATSIEEVAANLRTVLAPHLDSIDLVFSAHGTPFTGDARAEIRRLIGAD